MRKVTMFVVLMLFAYSAPAIEFWHLINKREADTAVQEYLKQYTLHTIYNTMDYKIVECLVKDKVVMKVLLTPSGRNNHIICGVTVFHFKDKRYGKYQGSLPEGLQWKDDWADICANNKLPSRHISSYPIRLQNTSYPKLPFSWIEFGFADSGLDKLALMQTYNPRELNKICIVTDDRHFNMIH